MTGKVSEQVAALNANPISSDPLYAIIGVGVALLVVDFAFGNLICARAKPSDFVYDFFFAKQKPKPKASTRPPGGWHVGGDGVGGGARAAAWA